MDPRGDKKVIPQKMGNMPQTRRFLSKSDFGEIDFKNDRLKLKINVNPTSWDYSRPF